MKEVSNNFGAIRDTILRVSSKQLVRENTGESSVMKNFLNEIKNSYSLKIQQLIYKNLETANFDKERLAERYVNQNMKLASGLNWKTLLDENTKLRRNVIGEHHIEGEVNKSELYENIHILIESNSRKNYSDINKSEKAHEFIMSHLLRKIEDSSKEKTVNESEDMPNFFSWKFITEKAVSNFNERYSHLNEVERNLLKILLAPFEEKKNYLDSLKTENVKLISNLLKESSVDDYTKENLKNFEVKMKTSEEMINEETIDEYVMNFSELNENLKESAVK